MTALRLASGLALLLLTPGIAAAQPGDAAPVAPLADGPPPDAAEPAPPAELAPPARLSLQGAGTRQLRLEGPAPAVVFPLDASRMLDDLEVIVLEATFGSPPATVDGAFQVEAELTDRGGALRVIGDPKRLRTGTYALRLRITGEGVQSYEPMVQVSVPEPELQVPQRLSVQRIRPLLPSVFGDGEASVEPLVLRELGRASGLSDVRVTQLGPLRDGNRNAVGQITVRTDALTVTPGGVAIIDYDVEPRHLPAGTLTGRLQLSAREMASPVEIEVEIESRVDPLWIIFLVLIGVLLGFVSRTLLGQWRARNEARDRGEGERRALEAALGFAADAAHRTRIAQAIEALDTAVRSTNPELIDAGVRTAAEQRVAARDALRARHEALSKRLQDLVDAASGRPLPQRVGDRLDGALDGIGLALTERQTDRAEGLLDALTGDPGLGGLRRAWLDWKVDAAQALGTVERLGDLATADAAAAREALDAIDDDGDLLALVDRGAGAFGAIHQLVAGLWVEVEQNIETVIGRLGGRIETAAAARLRGQLRQSRSSLVDGAAPISALAVLTTEVTGGLAAAIRAARPGPQTEDLLAAGGFVAAAAERPRTRGGEIPESAMDGLDPAATLGPSPVGAQIMPSAPPPGPAAWRRDLAVARLAFDAPPPPQPSASGRVWLGDIVSSLINAVIIALVAYVVYAEDFIGDGNQVISTLLWAYGVDLGAEAVKEQLRRVTPLGASRRR